MASIFQQARSGGLSTLRKSLKGVGKYAVRGQSPYTSISQGAFQVANNIIQEETQSRLRDQAAVVARQDIVAKETISTAYQEAISDQDYDAVAFKDRTDSARDSWLLGLPEEARDQGALTWDQRVSDLGIKLGGEAIQLQADEDNATINTAMEGTEDELFDAERDGNPQAAAAAFSRIDGYLASRTDFTPAQKEKYKQNLRDNAETQAVIGEYERSGGLADKKAFIETLKTTDAIKDPFRRDKLSNHITALYADEVAQVKAATAQKVAERKGEAAKEVNLTELAIKRGQAGHTEVQNLVDKGVIEYGDSQYLKLSKDADAANKAKMTIQTESAWVSSVMSGSTPPTPAAPKYQKAIDSSFGTYLESEGRATGYELNAHIETMVKKTKAIPNQAIVMLSGLQFGTPEQQAEAADLYDRLQTAAPAITPASNKQEVARAAVLNSFIKAGHKPDEAVKLTDQAMNPANKEIMRSRELIISQKVKDQGTPMISDSDITDMFDKGVWYDEPDVAADLMGVISADAQGEYMRIYQLTGSEDAAKDASLKAVKRLYGETNIYGTKTLMKYAPESFYGDWVGKDLAKWAKSNGAEDGNVRLITDSRTSREATGGQPTYGVLKEDENGLLNYIGRWKPDAQAHAEGVARREKEKAKRQIGVLVDQQTMQKQEFADAQAALSKAEKSGDGAAIQEAQHNVDLLAGYTVEGED